MKGILWILSGLLWILPCAAGAQRGGVTQPVNSGFEANPVQQGWEVTVYGAPSRLERDTQIVHEGRSALRISASAPSDTALGQEIRLTPGHAYRLRGWVRTRGLDPHGAPVYGTLQVQMPHGQGILASGASHGGDTDWTEVAAPFLAPADGHVRLCVFFVGFGKGTGAAWFDALRLEEIDLAMNPITVTREPFCAGEISPLQYGQFIEYLCDLVPSMWAEKLYDGSFEGLSPYKFVYLKETDFKEKPWYPSGATNRAEYSHDNTTKVSGEVSQKIAVVGGAPCTVGISQNGIAVQHGSACRFSCYLRAQDLAGPVRVRLHHEGKVYASAELHPTGEWGKVHVRLIPSETDANATLSIEYRGPGTLWLDNASLMPEDTVGGWRKDVVEAVRALKPGVIRFGGSALDDSNLGDFRWLDTIGDPDKRKPFRAWGGLQPTGPGLEEIVQLCYAVGAEPLLCVRFTHTTPEQAAEQVQYFNGPVNTPFGAMRAKNGHPEPYHIRFWQVGNERSSKEYEEGLPAFCKAMRQADPTIKLLSSYPTEGVLHNAGDLLDYVCPHHYSTDLPGMDNDLYSIAKLIAAEAPGRNIKVGVTEWNTTAGDAGPRRAMLWDLDNALACSRYQNLLHRHCDLAEIANRSNLTNSFCSGIIQTDNHRLYKTPTYYAQQLYATLAGNRPLKLHSDLPPEIGPDLSATLSADGTTLTLFAVNFTGQEIARPLDLSAFGAQGQQAEVWTLADREHAGEPDVTNSFGDPTRIAPVKSAFSAPSAHFTYHFPPYSLTILRWKVTP
ncbi:MAG TPA: alpha-L-arabinofuranosidase C-terminal domain-containing protein [Chthonomonadaceae bacterium]|nr:alpha-L-arabinofuranosidase C-terminal domain-containing protein [Chthonomonadaceae bacterium]